MRILRVEHQGTIKFAVWEDELKLAVLSAAPWEGGQRSGELVARHDVRLLAPVTPSKVVCVGRNYAAHAKELGNEVPKEPLIFLKPPSSITMQGAPIVLPKQSERVEHEAEIGAVIGKRLRNASSAEARAGIFGYTCVNDVTARDIQRRETQFTRAKGFDTFCPVGPWIETDISPESLAVSCRVNGETRQSGNSAQMVFPIVELVAFISTVMTLEPGDLISTGTPEGVGPLAPNDVVEIEVEGIGTLVNVVEASA